MTRPKHIVEATSRVEFHPFGSRKDGNDWIVGRIGSSDFAAIPSEGISVIRWLEAGRSIGECQSQLLKETGRKIDVTAFVEGLVTLGIVASVGGQYIRIEETKVTFSGVKQQHVRWMLNPLFHLLLFFVIAGGVVAATLRPAIVPQLSDLVWSRHGTFVLVSQCLLTWSLIFLHELSHLFTARAAGIPGKIRLSTRLQYLVAQTDVSGVWLADRRTRMSVYLSGIVLNLTICSGCLIWMAFFGTKLILSIISMVLLLATAYEFMFFMRTDIYFVFQDLSSCRNLFNDAGRYIVYLSARIIGRRAANPLSSMRPIERRYVSIYAAFVTVGTSVALTLYASTLVHVSWVLWSHAFSELVNGPGASDRVDATVTILVITSVHMLWLVAWCRRHRMRVVKFFKCFLRTIGASRVGRSSDSRSAGGSEGIY